MRIKKSILNFTSGYIFYIILAILGFVKIKFFIGGLGEELFALNQLYSSVFMYLTLAEAGVGSALLYKLYKPLSNKDFDRVNYLFSETKNILKYIGLLIIGLSFAVSFILPIFINGNSFSLLFINVTFFLFVLKSVIDYFMYASRLVVEADQNNYKINVSLYGFRILEILIEILVLYIGFNYILFLIPSIIVRILQNIYINKKIKKLYPWLKYEKNKKTSEIKSDIKVLFVHRILALVTNNIDIVILSTFANSTIVTIYAVYNYITKYINDTIAQIYNAIKNGLAEIIHSENQEKIDSEIENTRIIFSFLAVISTLFLALNLNIFIGFWVGNEYIVDKITLFLFICIVYYNIIIRETLILRDILGMFKQTQLISIVTAIINLALSLILVQFFEIKGVLIATIIASYLIMLIFLPRIVLKNMNKKIKINHYVIHFKNFTIFAIIYCGITQLFTPIFSELSNIFDMLIYFSVNSFFIVVISILLFSIFYKSFQIIIEKLLYVILKRKFSFKKIKLIIFGFLIATTLFLAGLNLLNQDERVSVVDVKNDFEINNDDLKLIEEKNTKYIFINDFYSEYNDDRDLVLKKVKRNLSNGNYIYFFNIENKGLVSRDVDVSYSFFKQFNIVSEFQFDQYEVEHKFSNLVGYNKLTLPDSYIITTDGSFVFSKNFYYKNLVKKYENGDISTLKELQNEQVGLSNSGDFKNKLSIDPGESVDFYIIFSKKNLISNIDEFTTLFNTNGLSPWLTATGTNFKLPYSIEPFTRDGYGLNLGANASKKIISCYEKTNDEIYKILMENTIMNFNVMKRDKSGVWLTTYTSTWLKNDYGIRAPFVDTRFNETIAYYLKILSSELDIAELKKSDKYYLNYLISEYNEGNLMNINRTWLMPDYFSVNEHDVTHSSLNHQLAISNFLIRGYLEYGDIKYKNLGEKILDNIFEIGDNWIKENGDLWYQVNSKNEFWGTDYKFVTLEDLLLTKELSLENNIIVNDKMLDKLIFSKYNYLKASKISIPREINERYIKIYN